jgi:hypothetical protein
LSALASPLAQQITILAEAHDVVLTRPVERIDLLEAPTQILSVDL